MSFKKLEIFWLVKKANLEVAFLEQLLVAVVVFLEVPKIRTNLKQASDLNYLVWEPLHKHHFLLLATKEIQVEVNFLQDSLPHP